MSKEHCCCGSIHVRTGALIIGSLILILGIIGLLASVATGNVRGIVSSVFNIISGGCIIYADKSLRPVGYLPFLIFEAIRIVIFTIMIVIFAIMAIAAPRTLFKYINDYGGIQHKSRYADTTGFFLFVAVVMAFVDWFVIWLWVVVYRAYQHMKDAEEGDRGQTYQAKFNDV